MGKGDLYNVMRFTRRKYHHAIKLAKRETQILDSEDLGAAAASGNAALFKEMKKYLTSKKGSGQEFPDSLEGADSHEDILDKFRSCYEGLYNSADRSAEMVTVNAHINDLIRQNVPTSHHEASKVTPGLVRLAAEKMKPSC